MKTIKEVAALFQICERTVWRWISAGELKTFRRGVVVRVSDKQIADFVKKSEAR